MIKGRIIQYTNDFPLVNGIVIQPTAGNLKTDRSWEVLGANKVLYPSLAVDGVSFVPTTRLPVRDSVLQFEYVEDHAYAKQIVVGLPAISNLTRARAEVKNLAALGADFVTKTPFPANKVGYHFPVTIGPEWVDAPKAMADVWSILPRPLYVTVAYTPDSTDPVKSAAWLKSFIPDDVTVIYRDGRGEYGYNKTKVSNDLAELRALFGDKLEVMAEIYLKRGAQTLQLSPEEYIDRTRWYEDYAREGKLWAFDATQNLSTELLQVLTRTSRNVPPRNLTATVNDADDVGIVFEKASKARVPVRGYRVRIYDSNGWNILREIETHDFTTMIPYPSNLVHEDFPVAPEILAFSVQEKGNVVDSDWTPIAYVPVEFVEVNPMVVGVMGGIYAHSWFTKWTDSTNPSPEWNETDSDGTASAKLKAKLKELTGLENRDLTVKNLTWKGMFTTRSIADLSNDPDKDYWWNDVDNEPGQMLVNMTANGDFDDLTHVIYMGVNDYLMVDEYPTQEAFVSEQIRQFEPKIFEYITNGGERSVWVMPNLRSWKEKGIEFTKSYGQWVVRESQRAGAEDISYVKVGSWGVDAGASFSYWNEAGEFEQPMIPDPSAVQSDGNEYFYADLEGVYPSPIEACTAMAKSRGSTFYSVDESFCTWRKPDGNLAATGAPSKRVSTCTTGNWWVAGECLSERPLVPDPQWDLRIPVETGWEVSDGYMWSASEQGNTGYYKTAMQACVEFAKGYGGSDGTCTLVTDGETSKLWHMNGVGFNMSTHRFGASDCPAGSYLYQGNCTPEKPTKPNPKRAQEIPDPNAMASDGNEYHANGGPGWYPTKQEACQAVADEMVGSSTMYVEYYVASIDTSCRINGKTATGEIGWNLATPSLETRVWEGCPAGYWYDEAGNCTEAQPRIPNPIYDPENPDNMLGPNNLRIPLPEYAGLTAEEFAVALVEDTTKESNAPTWVTMPKVNPTVMWSANEGAAVLWTPTTNSGGQWKVTNFNVDTGEIISVKTVGTASWTFTPTEMTAVYGEAAKSLRISICGWDATAGTEGVNTVFEADAPPVDVATDPYWSYVALLLHMDGPDVAGGTPVYPNKAPSSVTIDVSGNVPVDINRKKFGAGSAKCGGGHLFATQHIYPVLSEDFTVETWMYVTVLPSQVMRVAGYQKSIGGAETWTLNVEPDGRLTFTMYDTSWRTAATLPSSIPLNRWVHIAGVKRGTELSVYLDGIKGPQTANLTTAPITPESVLAIGRAGDWPAQYFNGNLDEFRITKGIARYSGDFAVPTEPFPERGPDTGVDQYFSSVSLLMHLDGNGNDVKGTTMTAMGSPTFSSAPGSFNQAMTLTQQGVGYYAPLSQEHLALGTGDFTVEFRAKLKTLSSQNVAISAFDSTPGASGWNINFTADNELRWYYNVGGSDFGFPIVVKDAAIFNDAWHSIAFVRKNGVLTCYVDGLSRASAPDTREYKRTAVNLSIGFQANGVSRYGFIGSLDEVRITKNVARYSGNYTPEVMPFPDNGPAIPTDPNFSNVTSLLHGDGAENSMVFTDVKGLTWQTYGTPGIQTTRKKFGTGSIRMGAQYDYLTTNGSVSSFTHVGDYTVEAWVYQNAPANAALFSRGADSGGLFVHGIRADGTLTTTYNLPGAYGSVYTSSLEAGVATGWQWNHIAYVKQGLTLRMFINGVKVSEHSLSAEPSAPASLGFMLGNDTRDVARFFSGNIDDFRWTQGVARYTGNFTVPTQPFPDA